MQLEPEKPKNADDFVQTSKKLNTKIQSLISSSSTLQQSQIEKITRTLRENKLLGS